MRPTRTQKADTSIEELLRQAANIDPELANILRSKYEQDRAEFAQAAREWAPSNDPAYWAKKSCQKCYGRGKIGDRHLFPFKQPAVSGIDENGNKYYVNSAAKVPVQCSCTRKNYEKWLAEFRVFYNELKAISLAHFAEKAERETEEDGA